MRIAIAGLGAAALRGHLPAIARLASGGALTLIGAADPDARRRADVEARHPRVALFETAEAMLASVDADVLVVAAAPSAHADLVALGLRRGLHVICEKPLVIDRSQYDRVAQAHAQWPRQGIVSVHQYRYSPTWIWIARGARFAARRHLPFSLSVDVQRREMDVLAMSAWRADMGSSGGMLADHGVHYLALAWAIDQHLDVLAGVRARSGAREQSGASVRLGTGMLTIQVGIGAPARRTRIRLHVASITVTWADERLTIAVGQRTVVSRAVDGLADRAYVDSLYDNFYCDVVRNLERSAWRAHRTAEALVVGRALVNLLESMPSAAAAA